MGLVITAFVMITLLSVSAILRVEANESRRQASLLRQKPNRFLS